MLRRHLGSLRKVSFYVLLGGLTQAARGMVVGSKGPTTDGTSVKADQQVANQQTGSADHLELGMRKDS